MAVHNFTSRHIGPRENDLREMLETVGVSSLDDLVGQTIPSSIRLKNDMKLGPALSEEEYLDELKQKASRNKNFRSFIGLGYYHTHLPAVIRRNILENPGWYTAYTPYQAEISQGRLEALLNFQTMVMDLTGMELANSSLLDEATAAAEGMSLAFENRSRQAKKNNANKFFVSEKCFPQTIDVLKTRSEPLGIELVIGDPAQAEADPSFFGGLVQYPDVDGAIKSYESFVAKMHENEGLVVVSADIMSLTLLTPPGEWGADVVVGSTQRFGVPLGYGGPHAAYFATKEKFKRSVPGRIIGVTVDSHGNKALRMALQTREQHIKRARATSNICTAQVLLAVMAGMYAAYHGKDGLVSIAGDIHKKTTQLASAITALGHKVKNEHFFDTITIELNGVDNEEVKGEALAMGINLRYNEDNTVSISLDEATGNDDLKDLIGVFEKATGKESGQVNGAERRIPDELSRSSEFLKHPVFNIYHSETEMMRYMKKLENRDISLTHSMIPLGSCTMKLNAATQLFPLTWSEFANIHPFAPADQAEGYHEIIEELEKQLCEITGFDAVSLQPNSGAQGEYAGLMVIRAYHKDRGEEHRNVVLIPSSAHGTNPASGVMAGMKVVVVKCDDNGNIDLEDLKKKAEKHKENLGALMVTYPSTHGVFEEKIMEVTETVHEYGGQVYMDGANMNAKVGLTNPAIIGADVCHLNLHKTFAIPHGGGGPGMGPIGVGSHLAPFLPTNPVKPTGGDKAISSISAAPWGSALILLISYGYIKMLGLEGLKKATKMAILNANYVKARLKGHYETLYANEKNKVAHEMIMECRGFKKEAGIDVQDIAKRLIDYGFHAPTVSFPVNGTMMIEPTESESKEELDRFTDALKSIRKEIEEVASGKADTEDNVLKNAPHTASELCSDEWKHSYGREKAAFPLSWVMDKKYWTTVGRVDDAHGDRNLICSCPPLENYEEEAVI